MKIKVIIIGVLIQSSAYALDTHAIDTVLEFQHMTKEAILKNDFELACKTQTLALNHALKNINNINDKIDIKSIKSFQSYACDLHKIKNFI